jgi:hypothetical protein
MAVASRYIQDNLDPQRALDDVLRRGTIDNDKRGPEATLDDLYLGILQRTSALTDSVTAATYVVGSILVAKSPLTPTRARCTA